jgi:lambda repressor-like predicted transcriptional regulator
MHPEDIKAEIRKCGGTLLGIAAKAIGRNGEPVSKSAVSKVIHGKLKSAAIANAIAQHVGKSTSTLWPKVYPRTAHKQGAAPGSK